MALKREPWHGQSQVVSPGFHRTMHPMCGHTADSVVTFPASSLYTASLVTPLRTNLRVAPCGFHRRFSRPRPSTSR